MIIVWNSSNLPFERATEGASGFDLRAHFSSDFREVPARGRFIFKTGLHFAIPRGFEGQIRPRSGIARDHGVIAATGTIDSDYRGEVGINLFNHSDIPYRVFPGDRIAQIVFTPVWRETDGAEIDLRDMWERLSGMKFVETKDELPKTARGDRGFGSTGR